MKKKYATLLTKKSKRTSASQQRKLPALSCDLEKLSTIAISGMSATSVAYAGALRALHEADLLKTVRCYAGNSAGGMIATLAALGYKGKNLENIILEQNPQNFYPLNFNWVRYLRKNLRREGVFSGAGLRKEAQIICAQRIGKPDLTFGELKNYQLKANQNDRHFFENLYDNAMANKLLYVKYKKDFKFDFENASRSSSVDAMMEIARSFSGLQLTGSEIIYRQDGSRKLKNIIFNAEQSPELKIATAIRISASMPFFFRNAHIKDKSGKDRIFTDGATSSLIPLENVLEDRKLPEQTLWMYGPLPLGENSMTDKEGNFIATKVLKLIAKVIGKKEKASLPYEKRAPQEIGDTIIKEIIGKFDEQVEECLSNEAFTTNLLKVNRLGIKAENLNIGKKEKIELMKDAYDTTWMEIEKLTDKKKSVAPNLTTNKGTLQR